MVAGSLLTCAWDVTGGRAAWTFRAGSKPRRILCQ